jgi:hypothetical protein
MKRVAVVVALAASSPGCSGGPESEGAVATPSAGDASTEADVALPPDGAADAPDAPVPDAVTDALPDVAPDVSDDAAADAAADATEDAPGGPFIPTEMRGGLIHTGPVPEKTPPSWNAHLPKLVGDGEYWYAVHTHFPQAVADRYAAIMRRAVGSALDAWVEVARVSYPHQPPGIVMDTSLRMHMVFDCLRPGSQDVTCFPGGAGTAGNTSRFYHLVFSARDANGALRFDTYTNHDEWTGESNGYQGIGTTSDGVTVWALANSSWERVVQWWSSGAQYGTAATLSVTPAYLLYPIIAGQPALGSSQLVVYAGEFDPSGGNNASYLASTAYSGSTSSLSQLFRRAPAQPEPGTVNAYPSDLAHDAHGTLYALSYLPEGTGQCTELLRFEAGLAHPPTVVKVGCSSTYAKLKHASDGALYLLTPGSGPNVTVGVSTDRGDNFSWYSVPITGLPSNGDVRYVGFTPVKPYTSPVAHEPDRWVVFFAGLDASDSATHSYVGEIDLAP